MSDLGAEITAFLTDRYGDAEARARRLLRIAQDTSLELQDPKLLGRHIPGWHSWRDVETICEERLADIAAKRATLAEHHPIESIYGTVCAVCVDWQDVPFADGGETEFGIAIPRDWPCPEIRRRAAEFADHPAYKETWKP